MSNKRERAGWPACLLAGALLLSASVASAQACGAAGSEPIGVSSQDWKQYRCTMRFEVDGASAWRTCLNRKDYTSQRGEGCPGQERCCPPEAITLNRLTASPAHTTPSSPISKGEQDLRAGVDKVTRVLTLGGVGSLALLISGIIGIITRTRSAARGFRQQGGPGARAGARRKELWLAYLLLTLVGTLGVHRIYLGYVTSGIAQGGLLIVAWLTMLSSYGLFFSLFVSGSVAVSLGGAIAAFALSLGLAFTAILWWVMDFFMLPMMTVASNAVGGVVDTAVEFVGVGRDDDTWLQ